MITSSSSNHGSERIMEKAQRETSQPVWRFLAGLRKLDLRVSSEEGRLRVSAPPGVLTAELREELAARKAEILDFLRESRILNGDDGPLLHPVPRGRPLPLSFAQQRLWMIEQMNPGGSGYHVGLRLRLEGALSVSALRWAIVELVRRHESLRTRFPMGDDGPVQEIVTDWEPSLDEIDFSQEGSWEKAEAEAFRDSAMEGQRAYDLAAGPLVRWRLYRLDRKLHILWVGMHHIVTDGWSITVMYRELAELYEAAATPRPSSLSPLSLQYADFAVWQRNWLSGDVLQKQLDYWRRQLAGASRLEVPADRPPLAEPGFRGVGERLSIESDVVSELKQLASQEGATLFMTLLTGLQVLLHRYTGQDDIVVGSPIANRNRTELEGIVGFFVNALVLRADLSGNPTFRETLRRTREVTFKAYEFQDMPFERLVEDLMPERSLGQSPFFQVMLSLQNLSLRRTFDAGGVRMSLVESKALMCRFELEIHLWETSEGLTGQVVYNPERFNADRMVRMVKHYCRLLAEAAREPDRRLSELPLLDQEESRQLLVEWNQTATDYPKDKRIHELFEEQVRTQPDALALECGEETISYSELNRRANQLSAHLRELGVGVGTRVAICMERAPEMISGILGILKAGGVYVPLDPSYPRERLNFMIKDSEAPVAITLEPFADDLSESGAKVISLDRELAAIERQPGKNVTIPGSEADDLAYVIYTSGSTGMPKGVAVPHRAITRLVSNTNYIELSPTDVVAHLSQVCFDAATFEIWGALSNGARLVLISKEVALEPELFASALKDHTVNTLFLTTALFNELAAWNGRIFEGIKQVLVGGEAVNPHWVRHVVESGPPKRLLNAYGPTECTTFATFYSVQDVPPGATTIPIGRPISNTTAYVLDAHRNPVPVGVPGELYLGGPGLAQLYLNRPELTQEKFVPDPFCTGEGQRLYRTGDIVKYLPDGNIEFIGRADQQLKIRGFRIEPGEVEVVLGSHANVEAAVVVAPEDEPGERRLVAYIVPRSENASRDWRDFLMGKMPAYMIPSAFIELEALPMTASGKVDRQALPAPESPGEAYSPPRTPQEEILCEIFADLLSVERVGINDNFFELGGHSLLAIRLVLRLRKIVQIEVPVTAVFEHPTISDLSRHLDGLGAGRLATVRPSIEKISRDQPLPLSFAQRRLWMIEQMNPGRSGYHVGLRLRLEGILSVSALRSAIVQLVRRHESLRTRFPLVGDEPRQEVIAGWEPQLDEIDLSAQGAAERGEAEALQDAAQEGQRAYDLAAGPLVRWRLYRLDSKLHILWMGMHHIVTDGWSLTVMYRELAELYEAAATPRPSSLSPLSLQYADFAVWQRNWLSGDVLQKQLDYWRRQLTGASRLEVPADRPPLAEPGFRGVGERISIESDAVSELKRLASEERATLFMTLLTGLQVLLHRYTGQDDIVVGSPIANRNRTEVESIVGFFVNALVLRADLSGNPTFREALRRTREVTLKAYEFQDMPFEKLVEDLMPERSLGQSPLIQVMLSLQNFPLRRSFEARGLRVSLIGSKVLTSRFELEIHLWETGEGLTGQLVYNPERFNADRMVRMVKHYCRVLAEAAREPDRRLPELPLLDEEESRQLLVEWNQTATDYPKDKRIHELFEEQVRTQPDAIALECGEEAISYSELNRRANQLAAHLRELGVGVGTRVAICMERSPEMISGILGILKAGGVYVPLDPSYPRERLNFMIKDSEAPVAITLEPFADALSESGARVISLDRELAAIEREPGNNVTIPGSEADDLAYVIYTSGSTGMPKGVAVPHRAITRLVSNTNYIELSPTDVVAHLSQVCFDAATFEIWGALSNGARLVLISKEVALEPELFASALKDHTVSTLFLTTALFNELAAWNGRIFEGIKQVLFGGEAVNPHWVRHVVESGPPKRLLHVYGPTECTTFATFYPVQQVPAGATTIPIGRPISNTTAYVLDGHRNPVPVGVPGELYLGGPGLAQLYLNRPELTQEKFVPDPFCRSDGQRLYKTGDIVKYLPDGNIEFIGRADQQLKIRGFRIEPGEIEVVLGSHANVEAAVVVAREDEPGERQLVAYIVPRNGSASRDWRDFLMGKMPAYMIPSAFIELEALPMTASGKVDRQALPAPESPGEAYSPPRTPQEEILCEIFADLLSVERVGINDNFFELGGHSLLAIRLVLRLRKIVQIEVPVTAVFEHPTISDLSRHLDGLGAGGLATVRPSIEKISRDQPLPLSFAQERLWRNERNGATADNINVVVLDLKGNLNIVCLERTFQELVRRHEVFRTTFHFVGDVPVQRIAHDQTTTLELFDLSAAADAEMEAQRLVIREKTDPLSLEHGPLVRFLVVRFGARHHRLVMKLHHIVYDMWSLPIFQRELQTLYQAFVSGKDCPLPAPTVQLADFAVWQRRYLSPDSGAFQAQLAYWREQLSGELPILRLPCERPHRLETASTANVLAPFEMPEELTAKIRAITRSEGTTLFMTFLAGLKALINLTTGQNDIMLGVYLAKRSVPGSEDMMGYFCDITFLRTKVSSHLSFLELLRAVRETVLNAHAHEEMPFDVLREEIEKLGQVPPALRALFMFETVSELSFQLNDLQVNHVPMAAGNAMPWRFQMRVHDGGGAFSGRAKFDARLHDPSLVRRMMHNYVRLLEAIAAKPSTRLCDIEEELGSW